MNRFEFGQLVASLRLDIGWTQTELAEQSGLPVAVISNVERGERRGLLKDNILLKLAQGLQLTSLERREFVLAASGVAEQELNQPVEDRQLSFRQAEKFIGDMSESIACFTVPAFVTDSYSDILLVNNAALSFYNPPQFFLETDTGQVGAFNQMRYVFHAKTSMRELQGPVWEKSALMAVRYFRRRTMRVRATRYYADLMEHLRDEREYPLFYKFYRRILYELHDDFYHEVKKPVDENEVAFSEFTVFLATTPFGELNLHYLAPLNDKTSGIFAAVYQQVGRGSQRFALYPDMRKI
jgi:transcriptional regulator with XRE-family HTH domain